ncbi:MAG TPA: RNA polymerase sigma factor, partial [Solirubrobacteraceae bacterium]
MLARAGHERAFVAIVERYRRPLHAFTRRLVPEGRVEDVLQQAFMSAWAALCGGAEVRHLRGWLHQIVRHAAIAVAAAPGDEPLPETIVGEGGPEAEVELRLLVRETLDNVARLPDHQRAAVVKTAMEGRSREEVASSLGVTEGAVRGLLHRARTTLRAAATAVTPMPLAAWAAGGRGPGVEHVAEL